MICNGSYTPAIRRHPVTGAAECAACGNRFDVGQLAGVGTNVPGHSPGFAFYPAAPTLRAAAAKVRT